MKRFICLITLLCIFLTSFSAFAEEEEGFAFPQYGDKIQVGRLTWSAEVHRGAVCYTREGDPLVCFGTQGGFFFAVDLQTGKVYDRFNAIGSSGYIYANSCLGTSDNKVFMWYYPSKTWNVYDPIARTFVERPSDLSQINDYNFFMQNGSTMSHDDIQYFGDYREGGASLYEYHTKTGKLVRHGPFLADAAYVKGTAYDDNYLYAGTGGTPENVRVYRVNRKTGEIDEILRNPGGGIVYDMVMCNDRLVVYTFGKFTIMDTSVEPPVVAGVLGGGTPSFPAPFNNDLCYYFANGNVYEINAKELTRKVVGKCSGSKIAQWAQLPNRDWVIPVLSGNFGTLSYFNPRTGETVVNKINDTAEAGPNIQSLEISESGHVVGGGYQTSMGVYNMYTKESIIDEPGWTQNEGAGFFRGDVIMGTYTDAVMYRWDPERPWEYITYDYDTKYRGYEQNPTMLYDIEDSQDRPFLVKSFDDEEIYVGTMSAYNVTGGALTIIGPEDGVNPPKTEVFRHVIPEHTICGAAKKGNILYVSSAARNGLGAPEPQSKDAAIYSFDLEKREVIADITPEIPEPSDRDSSIGDISIGPDGLLWGSYSKDGYVFAMDPETGEIVKSVSVNPGFERGGHARPLYHRWGDDGLLYTTAGWVVSAIDPITMKYKVVEGNCSLMTLDPDGNVWVGKGSGAQWVPVNQYDRLQGFIKTFSVYPLDKAKYTEEEWEEMNKLLEIAKTYTRETDEDEIKLQIRKIKAIRDHNPRLLPKDNHLEISINGEKQEYFEFSTGIIRNWKNKTYVPYRAFLESLGYKVKWNVHQYLLIAEKEGSKLEFIANEKGFTHNGKRVECEEKPLIFGSGLNLPLRAVAEELGYEVTYNHETKMVDINEK